ncbi:MAG TPA: response regulator [Caulobacteraceae bacterium]|jgi:CheY-like chemotaxis protein|nr:response regulator [Caulobacteraceae bacterium]
MMDVGPEVEIGGGNMAYNILVVDDSKLARMAIAKALNTRYADWNRLEAANAEEAAELVKQSRIDVALLDFNMPGRDGLVLAAELRAQRPNLPVAVVSANHQAEIVNRAHEIGAVFLTKPVTEAALNAFLADAIRQFEAPER